MLHNLVSESEQLSLIKKETTKEEKTPDSLDIMLNEKYTWLITILGFFIGFIIIIDLLVIGIISYKLYKHIQHYKKLKNEYIINAEKNGNNFLNHNSVALDNIQINSNEDEQKNIFEDNVYSKNGENPTDPSYYKNYIEPLPKKNEEQDKNFINKNPQDNQQKNLQRNLQPNIKEINNLPKQVSAQEKQELLLIGLLSIFRDKIDSHWPKNKYKKIRQKITKILNNVFKHPSYIVKIWYAIKIIDFIKRNNINFTFINKAFVGISYVENRSRAYKDFIFLKWTFSNFSNMKTRVKELAEYLNIRESTLKIIIENLSRIKSLKKQWKN